MLGKLQLSVNTPDAKVAAMHHPSWKSNELSLLAFDMGDSVHILHDF